MSLPTDVIAECTHSIKLLARREARALSRIRSALRTLKDVRTKMARDRKNLERAISEQIKETK